MPDGFSSGVQIGMSLDETRHPVRHRPYIAAVAIVIVHDDPLIVTKRFDFVTLTHQPRIGIAYKTGKHGDPCP